MYPTIKRFPGNRHGTYFGRLVEFPSAVGDVDQLSRVLEKLRAQVIGQHFSSVYEVNVQSADDAPIEGGGTHIDVFEDGLDGNLLRGFPCLSSCAFHLDAQGGRLHLVALYRNEFLVQKAYGNYLGLGRLLGFMAEEAGIEVGELFVIAGHAELDGQLTRARQVISIDPSA